MEQDQMVKAHALDAAQETAEVDRHGRFLTKNTVKRPLGKYKTDGCRKQIQPVKK